MLSVILIWLYIAMTAFLLGFGVLEGLRQRLYQGKLLFLHTDAYLICGLAAATVYAQAFSLFASVGLGANTLLTGICLMILFIDRKKLTSWLHEIRGQNVTIIKIFLWFGLILLYSYGTSRGISHYDTGLYHAQSIRWIETYGVVKGLGNLHCRLAYNSASFALSALYSMAFLGGQSYHTCVGFMALILAAVCLEIKNVFQERRLRASAFARVMGFYYLFSVFDEMVSPASDYFMVLTAFYIVIRWMDLLEENEEEILPYAILCILCVFLMTVKLSAALIALLIIKPASMLIRQRKWLETGIYLFLGIVTALPYLIRNVILSGWLIYPFTAINLFGVDWKIPKKIADYDAREIQVYGRGYSDVSRYSISIAEWLPDWFTNLGRTEQLLVAMAIFSSLVLLVRMAWKLIHGSMTIRWDSILLEIVLTLCFWFWLLSSPLMRYGCVYVYLISACLWGDICLEWLVRGKDKEVSAQAKVGGRIPNGIYGSVNTVVLTLIGLFLIYKIAVFGKELTVFYVNDHWIRQQDYEYFETKPYEIEGITFYVPAEGDRTGYEGFPSSPTKAQIKLRGDTLKNGFVYEVYK